ncbi:SusC/RagA family TonB-linked outer membrane protein [Zobellia roscoffensis]|uniref:SusC/RagA family TonB-linked outer membrane protein n=1 Tax=Zobellia roscoffensis TaxID=2779508 RepID=UPI00188CD425|nr:SusC/RagA family TonB-linked outer membrane protein [Zobellia roscoffensis]
MKKRKTKNRLLLVLLFCQLVFTSVTMAQEGNQQKIEVSGIVTDEYDMPMPYVNVYIQGTQAGTLTDLDGRYALKAEENQVIVFSYIGYSALEQPVPSDGFLSVSLEPDTSELSEVVVTALGIKKEKKAIGYAVDAISADEINSTGEPNVLLNLSAKAPGVQVSGSANGVDGSPRVLIRGVTSLSSDNQPLYVLDGLPLLSNRSLSESLFTSSSGSSDLGNPLSDINPNDIENISILKGASATALYGARGANGVIMITTKKGKSGQKGWGASISTSTTFQSALILPEPQLRYGQGNNGEYSYVDGNGAGVNETDTRLWGPEYNGQPISQWDPETGGAVVKPWQPYGANNLDNFFETGHTYQQNLSLTHVTETSNARFSLGHQDIKGITPNTGLERITGSFNSTFKLGEKLSLNFVATGSTMDSDNRSSYGFGNGGMWQALFIPTNIDIRDLRDYKDEFGNKTSFYQNGPNPYWDLYENVNPVTRTRFSFNVGLEYALADGLSLQANLFQDTNTTEYERIVAKHLFNTGSYQEGLDLNKEINADVRLNLNRDIYKDLNFNLMVGAANRNEKSNSKFASTDGGLLVTGIYNLGNSAKPATVNNRTSEKEVSSVFSSVEFNFKDYLYATLTGRNDWSSTLPKDDWSFFYPSASTSFIFTDAFNIKNKILTYGKLRGSWAKVGNDTQPYALDRFITRSSNAFNGQPVGGIDNVIPATTLVPEESTSFEVGGELYLFDSKVKLDVAYYKNESSNQLIRVENAWERGARFAFINAGTITNKGIEVKLDITPFETKDFRWDVNMNWSRNRGTVSGFPEDLVDFKHIAAWFGPEIRATNGEPYGHIVGFEYFRDTQDALANVPNMADDFNNFGYTAEDNIYGTGQILTKDGFPMHNQWRGTRDLGVSAPLDWTAGIRNSFRYKNFNLNFLFDLRYGGKIISTTYQYMSLNGLNPESAGDNINGVAVRESTEDNGGFIFEGIDVETGEPNTTAISTQDLYANFNYPTSALMRDATNIKLKELSIGYRLDRKVTKKLGLADVNISLVGRNLWLIKNNLDGIDTETANMGSLNNGSGFETGSLPNTKSFGMNFSVSF